MMMKKDYIQPATIVALAHVDTNLLADSGIITPGDDKEDTKPTPGTGEEIWFGAKQNPFANVYEEEYDEE